MELKKVNVYYSIDNGGDGSAYPSWYLTEKEAEWVQENADEGWGESCTGRVETFEGSNVHKDAVEGSRVVAAKAKAKEAGVEDWQWEYEDYLDA